MSWKGLEVGGQLGSYCRRVWANSSSDNAVVMKLSTEILKMEKDLKGLNEEE
jgi:hypothetical protein